MTPPELRVVLIRPRGWWAPDRGAEAATAPLSRAITGLYAGREVQAGIRPGLAGEVR